MLIVPKDLPIAQYKYREGRKGYAKGAKGSCEPGALRGSPGVLCDTGKKHC